MAEFLNKSVQEDGGGDYTTLEACMNANEQDLSSDGWFTVTIDGDWDNADSTAVTIHNYGTTVDDYITISTTGNSKHPGYFSNSSPYYRLVGSFEGTGAITHDTDYIKWNGIQLENTYSGSTSNSSGIDTNGDTLGAASSGFGFNEMIVISNGTGGSSGAVVVASNVSINCVNSVFIGRGRYGVYDNGDTGGTSYYYNCVFAGFGSSDGGYTLASSATTVTNCYAYSASGTAFGGAGTITTTTCASDDGSNSTSTVAYSTSSGCYFTNVTAGSEDFHITSTSSSLYDAGTDLSGTFTDDIDGDTRTVWSIGVDDGIQDNYIDTNGMTCCRVYQQAIG